MSIMIPKNPNDFQVCLPHICNMNLKINLILTVLNCVRIWLQLITHVLIVTRCPWHFQPCADVGGSCASNADCFTKNCHSGICVFTLKKKGRSLFQSKKRKIDWRSILHCEAVGEPCKHNEVCCTQNCGEDGACDHSNLGFRNGERISQAEWESIKCSGVEDPCSQNKDCCTENCNDGVCDY